MMESERKRRADVVWSCRAMRPQPDKASLYSRGNLTLTPYELRYDLSLINRLAGSRLFGMGTHLFRSDPWRSNLDGIASVDVVERVPELSAQRVPRPRLRIKLKSGSEELFIVDDPDDASASLQAAIQRCRRV